MAEVFTTSGESSDNVAVPSPILQGFLLPSMDNPLAVDGFGVVVPWGGGSTTRKYSDYGISAEVSRQSTQLNDLATGFIPGGGVNYNLEGLVGPQGERGADGTVLIIHQWEGVNSNYLTALPHNIDLINSLGTAADKLLYTSAYSTSQNFVWSNVTVESATKAWEDSDINTDASFHILVADTGIFVSTDGAATWAKKNPDSDSYVQSNCESSGGDAVVLGTDGKDRGAFLLTDDYGVSWSEITVTV